MMISKSIRNSKMVNEAFNGDYIIKESDSFEDEDSWFLPSLNKFKFPSFKRIDANAEMFKVYKKNIRHYQTDKIALSFLMPQEVTVSTSSPKIAVAEVSLKHDFIKKVLSFKTLINNWDGHGAIPLELESATNTITLINCADDLIISKIDDLYPNPNGTVSVLWRNQNDDAISLEIGNKTMSYYVKMLETEPEFFDDIKIDSSSVEKLSSFVRLL